MLNDKDEKEKYMLTWDKYISGTLIWFYNICKREVWLISREVIPDQENPYIDLGRAIHETTYESLSTKEVGFEGVRFDIYLKGKKTVCEVKTSSKYIDAAAMQVKYYLYRLKELGIEATGEINIPRERKKIRVLLDDKGIEALQKVFREIREIVSLPKPPPPKRIPFCRRCAYRDFCWV